MNGEQAIRISILVQLGAYYRQLLKPNDAGRRSQRNAEKASIAALEDAMGLRAGIVLAIARQELFFSAAQLQDIQEDIAEYQWAVQEDWQKFFQKPGSPAMGSVPSERDVSSVEEVEDRAIDDEGDPKWQARSPKAKGNDRRTVVGWPNEDEVRPKQIEEYRGLIANGRRNDEAVFVAPVESMQIASDQRWARRFVLEAVWLLSDKTAKQRYDSDKVAEFFEAIVSRLFPRWYATQAKAGSFVPRLISGQFHFTQLQMKQLVAEVGLDNPVCRARAKRREASQEGFDFTALLESKRWLRQFTESASPPGKV